jgi:glutathione S-transferase
MAEGLKRLEAAVREPSGETPGLDTITAIVALDYVHFRFPQAGWVPPLARLDRVRQHFRARPSVEQTVPY